MKKRILELNPLAVFVPCDNHSLNPTGVHAVNVNAGSVTFFGTIERLFKFFFLLHSLTERYKTIVNITVKRQSYIRWMQ